MIDRLGGSTDKWASLTTPAERVARADFEIGRLAKDQQKAAYERIIRERNFTKDEIDALDDYLATPDVVSNKPDDRRAAVAPDRVSADPDLAEPHLEEDIPPHPDDAAVADGADDAVHHDHVDHGPDDPDEPRIHEPPPDEPSHEPHEPTAEPIEPPSAPLPPPDVPPASPPAPDRPTPPPETPEARRARELSERITGVLIVMINSRNQNFAELARLNAKGAAGLMIKIQDKVAAMRDRASLDNVERTLAQISEIQESEKYQEWQRERVVLCTRYGLQLADYEKIFNPKDRAAEKNSIDFLVPRRVGKKLVQKGLDWLYDTNMDEKDARSALKKARDIDWAARRQLKELDNAFAAIAVLAT